MRTPAPTGRLTFRCWTRADVELAASLWCDPDVMRFMGGPYMRDEVAARLEREIANLEERGIQYWPLFWSAATPVAALTGAADAVRAATGVAALQKNFIGCCGLKPNPDNLEQLEIGFHLLPAYWGRGFAAEAARAVIAYAFDVLGAHALYAGHHPQNEPSRALLTRLGFDEIGAHRFPRTGLDHPWYRLTRCRICGASRAGSCG